MSEIKSSLSVAVIILSTTYAGMLAAADFFPASLWGVNLLQYLPAASRASLYLITILAAIALMLLSRRLSLPPLGTRLFLYVILPAVLLAVLYHLRVGAHFLGDGILRARELEIGLYIQPTEPLAQIVNYLAFQLTKSAFGWSGLQSNAAVSFVGGILYYYALLAFVRELLSDKSDRIMAFIVLYFSGTTLLFCGYSETYVLLPALLVAYFTFGLKSLRQNASPHIAVALFLLLALLHFKSVIFAPSLWLLAWHLRHDHKTVVASTVVSMLIIAAAIVIVPYLSNLPRLDFSGFLMSLSSAETSYTLFSSQHLSDIYNELMLTAGAGIILLLSMSTVRGMLPVLKDRRFLFVAAALPGAFGLLIFVRSLLGYAVDWDLYSAAGLTINIAAITLYASATRRKESSPLLPAAQVGIMFVALLSFGAFALVNRDFDSALLRQEHLLGIYGGNEAAIGFESVGNYLINLGDEENAERLWKRSARLRPHPRTYGNLGQVLLNRGQLAEAEFYLRQGIELDSTYAGMHTNLGMVYYRRNRPEEAGPHLKKAVLMKPNDAGFHHNYALCLVALNRLAEAEFHAREAVRLRPNEVLFLSGLGGVLRYREQYRAGEAILREAIDLDPVYPESYFQLAILYRDAGQREYALGVLQSYIEMFPNSPVAERFRNKAREIAETSQ